MKAEPLRMLPRFDSTATPPTTSSIYHFKALSFEDVETEEKNRTDEDFLTLQTLSCPQLASSTRAGRRVKSRDENQSAEGTVTTSEMTLAAPIERENTASQHLLRS